MGKGWKVFTILLVVAVALLSVQIVMMQSKMNAPISLQERGEIVTDVIMTRSSVRTFSSQPVDEKTIETLLRAGMAAPTAGDKRPWNMIVITDREVLDAIPTAAPNASPAARAQLAIVVCGLPAQSYLENYWIQDCAIVSENILIAAHGMGLGAVWCGVYPDNGNGRFEAMSKLLATPEGVVPMNIIAIGYPDSEPNIKDKWDSSKVHHNIFNTPYFDIQ
ncbi:MAG: nitroreductase family protein [Rikenellaceae bacterium]